MRNTISETPGFCIGYYLGSLRRIRRLARKGDVDGIELVANLALRYRPTKQSVFTPEQRRELAEKCAALARGEA